LWCAVQWFKHFYESNLPADAGEYDAVGRRALGKGAEKMAIFAPGGGVRTGTVVGTVRKVGGAPSAPSRAANTDRLSQGSGKPTRLAAGATRAGADAAASGGGSAAPAALADVRRQLGEARAVVEGLEKERDFYFAKLRDIEILAQTYKGGDKAFCDQIFKILYATEDDFVAPEDAVADGALPEAPAAATEHDQDTAIDVREKEN